MPSLGKDLATIRKKLDLTIEDIHKATKIPTHILESIENDTIFDELSRNATYIRSYVRTYARELDINEERTIRALDQVERGSYTGLLRDDSEAGAIPKFQGKPQEPVQPEEPESPKSEQPDEPATPQHDMAFPEEEEDPASHRHMPPEETPSIHTVDWVDMGRRFTPLKSNSRIWVGLVILFIVVLSSLGIYYYLNQGPAERDSSPQQQQPSPATTTEAVESDSLQLNLSGGESDDESAERMQTLQAASLSDTLALVIYAAYEKLEPVRVYTDVVGSLNPYWIELGEAVRYKFVNTIRIRGPYDRMVLLLNGHLINNFEERFLNPETGMVEINREVFEGESRWLQPPPDSLGLDVPDPTIIKNQPIFN